MLPYVHLVLVGNYGVGNAGDEVLREYFLRRFPEITWSVLSANPRDGEFPRIPSGIRSVFFSNWSKTLRVLLKSDGMAFGGGTLFTDVESARACWIWFLHAFVSWMFRKPFYLTFQGIGPFKSRVGEWFAKWVIRHAVFISVRDVQSACRIERWKKNTEVIQSSDPSFLLLERKKSYSRVQNVFTFIPRFSTWKMSKNVVISVLKTLQNHGAIIHILSLQSGDKREKAFCDELQNQLNTEVTYVDSLFRAASVLKSSIVITERYHGAILAAVCGLPFFALRQYDGDKLHALSESLGQSCVLQSSFSVHDIDYVLLEECEQRVRQSCEKLSNQAMHGEMALRDSLQILAQK